MMGSLTRIQNALLSVGAVLGSLCLLAALVGVLFGVKPLMFKSGSMEPTIPTGGLALSIPVAADEIHLGDIVSTENSTGTRITHRVAAVVPATGYTQLTLKGDANDVVDAEIYAVTQVDRVFWSAPVLGYAVAGLSSPVALFMGGLLTAYLLYVAFGRRVDPDSGGKGPETGQTTTPSAERAAAGPAAAGAADGTGERPPPSRRRRGKRQAKTKAPRRDLNILRHTAGMAAAGALLLLCGILYSAGPASAVFAANASAESTFTAGELSVPHAPQCVLAGGLIGIGSGIVLSWSYQGEVPSSGYTISLNNASPVQRTSASIDLAARDANVSIRANKNAWRSKPLNVYVDYSAGVLGIGSRVTCSEVKQ